MIILHFNFSFSTEKVKYEKLAPAFGREVISHHFYKIHQEAQMYQPTGPKNLHLPILHISVLQLEVNLLHSKVSIIVCTQRKVKSKQI